MKKYFLCLALSVVSFIAMAQEEKKEEVKCIEESVNSDQKLNDDLKQAIKKKMSTSNNPIFNGRYLVHSVTQDITNIEKKGKVVEHEVRVVVVKKSDKGECKPMQIRLRRPVKEDGSAGAWYVDIGMPLTGTRDCSCWEKK